MFQSYKLQKVQEVNQEYLHFPREQAHQPFLLEHVLLHWGRVRRLTVALKEAATIQLLPGLPINQYVKKSDDKSSCIPI